MKNPYLSIVIAGRNDNYGGDFNQRLQNTLDWISHWVNHYHLPAELIFVNYNPIAENDSIAEMITFPVATSYFSTRIIEVAEDVHQELLEEGIRKPVPFFEFIAKNAGIRRAKGKFILCTNADVVFDPQIFEFLSKQNLEEGVFYRATRVDFNSKEKLIFKGNEANFLAQIHRNVFKYFMRGGTYLLKSPLSLYTTFRLLNIYNFVRRLFYTAIYPFRKITRIFYIPFSEELFTFQYACNASGDFFLMDKESWLKERGYPEDTWIATHCDSLHLLMTAVSGVRQKNLPWLVYHQEHERRFNFDTENHDMNLMYHHLLANGAVMTSQKCSFNTNTDDWGIFNYDLEETNV